MLLLCNPDILTFLISIKYYTCNFIILELLKNNTFIVIYGILLYNNRHI